MKNKQRGAILILFGLTLLALVGFLALGIEVGRWFLVRAELSKAVDAASLIGARNISNPYVNVTELAREVAFENFSPGYLDTPRYGVGSVDFQSAIIETNKVKVSGTVSSVGVLVRFFGIDLVATNSLGTAQKNEVEIMLDLDRSGSMAGRPIVDLKAAAITFLGFFEETQDKDKVGLISFATSVKVDRALGTNFVAPMRTAINAMTAVGATNAEDSLAQAGGPSSFTDQSGVPGERRVQQYLIFFSDGNPTAFRGNFRCKGADYDAVVCGTGQTCDTVYNQLGRTDAETWLNIDPSETGDGRAQGQTHCSRWPNTKWYVLDQYPIPGYTSESCHIPTTRLAPYICATARQMAIAHAQQLKDRNIKIYTIGLGGVDRAFLAAIASGPEYEYYTPTSSQLEAIFQKIAKDIKLRLVE